MERGYFDDFRDFRDKKGKVFMASDRLIPASQARPFPGIEALRPDGSPATFPPQQPEEEAEGGGRQAGGGTLLCVAFRAGAQVSGQGLGGWVAAVVGPRMHCAWTGIGNNRRHAYKKLCRPVSALKAALMRLAARWGPGRGHV